MASNKMTRCPPDQFPGGLEFKLLSQPSLFPFLFTDIENQNAFRIQRDGTQTVTFPGLGQVGREDIWGKESFVFQISSSERLLPSFIVKKAKAAYFVNLTTSFSLILVSTE